MILGWKGESEGPKGSSRIGVNRKKKGASLLGRRGKVG